MPDHSLFSITATSGECQLRSSALILEGESTTNASIELATVTNPRSAGDSVYLYQIRVLGERSVRFRDVGKLVLVK
jgi:hypothetical protein